MKLRRSRTEAQKVTPVTLCHIGFNSLAEAFDFGWALTMRSMGQESIF